MKTKIKPYPHSFLSKKNQIEKMFDRIALHYDVINRILSCGMDIQWRKTLVDYLVKYSPNHILDIATGTGDLAILSAVKIPNSSIIGLDFSIKMLDVARKKIASKQLNHRIKIYYGDAEHIPFKNNCFDAITVSFGIRNFGNLAIALSEILRVVRPQGHVLMLEFSRPLIFPIKQLYSIYSSYFLPFIGKILSKEKSAYRYLVDSTVEFPCGKNLQTIFIKSGFYDIQIVPLTCGIVTMYMMKKG